MQNVTPPQVPSELLPETSYRIAQKIVKLNGLVASYDSELAYSIRDVDDAIEQALVHFFCHLDRLVDVASGAKG